MKTFTKIVCGILVLAGLTYTVVGVSTRVDEIKVMAPDAMAENGWKVLRYEGYQLGSMWYHGGKVWYHVQNINDKSVQYRVKVTLWGGELHFHYDAPEKLNRLNVDYRQ